MIVVWSIRHSKNSMRTFILDDTLLGGVFYQRRKDHCGNPLTELFKLDTCSERAFFEG